MKAVDAFLVRNGVDVGKCFGLLFIVGSLEAFSEIIAYSLLGQLNLNFGAPLGLWIGIALWRHRPWSLLLLIVLSWLVAGIFVVVLLAAPVMGTANLTFKVGDLVINPPPLWQAYAFAAFVLPFLWFILMALHSRTAKAEFQPLQIDHGDRGEPSRDAT